MSKTTKRPPTINSVVKRLRRQADDGMPINQLTGGWRIAGGMIYVGVAVSSADSGQRLSLCADVYDDLDQFVKTITF